MAIEAAQIELGLGAYLARVERRLEAWKRSRLIERVWSRDPTVWFDPPRPQIVDRLGWLELPETAAREIGRLESFADDTRREGCREVVLLGMGGSSLAPELFGKTFGGRAGFPRLEVVDTTHPEAIRAVEARLEPARTLFIVSSKSGTTIETLSALDYFWRVVGREVPAGQRFVAITDPGTPLARRAVEQRFRRCFEGPVEVGGRYSALSVFGLLPAALVGADCPRLLQAAGAAARSCRREAGENPGALLGASIAELAAAGRDKLTLLLSPRLAAFGAWAEQLVAESTGKEGKGIVPVADEPLGEAEAYGDDRAFVLLRLEGDENERLDALAKRLEERGHPVVRVSLAALHDLGGQFFLWEFAIATAGAALGIHPFDQPDVQAAKDLAQSFIRGRGEAIESAAPASGAGGLRAARQLLEGLRPGDYFALQAYLAPGPETTAQLGAIRAAVRDRFRVATSAGYGPRFLHSTGQLHKGGPNRGVFLQLLDRPAEQLPVPGASYTFAELIRAQAMGDYRALCARGRRIRQLELRDVRRELAELRDLVAR
jgi:transaldolase/glucose-6-phosphate isomerase